MIREATHEYSSAEAVNPSKKKPAEKYRDSNLKPPLIDCNIFKWNFFFFHLFMKDFFYSCTRT